ncbi:MAG: ABC transporter ATP-binding protein [Nocardioides sp.]
MTETVSQPAAQTQKPAEDAIKLVGVAKNFQAHGEVVAAVQRVEMSILSGEFFSMLGPSGCGKTTTLRMIAGFEEPTEGQILLYGQDVVGIPPNHRDLNMVFQNYALFPHMNVLDNVAFGLRRKKLPKHDVETRVRDMLELVDLTGREKRRPREMSGGQQQRVALARALVNHPKVLLLDEPLGALDLKLRQAMQLELKRIQREVGITFVYVTHDQGEALTMSDRIAVMSNGLVEQLGSPREVYERPTTRFVADFIGTSNIVAGKPSRVVDGEAVLEFGDRQRVIVPLAGERHAEEVVVTIRPEKIALSHEPVEADCMLLGTVREVVYQGTFTGYTVDLPHGETIVSHRTNANDSDDVAVVGDSVWLTWSKRHCYPIRHTPGGTTDE